MADERRRKGFEILENIHGSHGSDVYDNLKNISPRMAEALIEYPYGKICDDNYLDSKMRETAILGALCALGYATPQLKSHINAGLNVGLEREEILEIFITMSVYAGFPAALNAIYAAQEVFEERGLV